MDQPNPQYRIENLEDRHDAPTVLSPVEARQGVMTGRVRWILAVSVTLVVAAFVVIYAIYA